MNSAPMVPVHLVYNTYVPIGGVDASLSPVLFLHGMGASKENWGDIPQNVANGTKRKTFALDARNHGDTEWSDEFSLDVATYDLFHFLDTEKMNKVILVGHSMGGKMAMKAALKQPEKIEKIIVEDVYLKDIPQKTLSSLKLYFSLARKAIEVVPSDLDEKEVKTFIAEYIHSNLPPKMQAKGKGYRETENMMYFKRDENGRFAFKSNIAVIERHFEELKSITSKNVGKYEAPACFIYGKLSPFKVNEEEAHIKEHFPNAVFEGIEEATHTVHKDCPIEFTDILLKFIS